MKHSVIRNILLVTADKNNLVNKNLEKYCKRYKTIFDDEWSWRQHIEMVFADYNYLISSFKRKFVNDENIDIFSIIRDFDSRYGDDRFLWNKIFDNYFDGADLISKFMIQENIDEVTRKKVMEDYFKCASFPMRYLK